MTFFDFPDPEPAYPERLQDMHRARGTTLGRTCKHCSYLIRQDSHTRSYLKCALFVQTHGKATDWQACWPACGAFAEAGQ